MESVTSTGDPRAAVPPVRMLDPWLAALSALLLVIGLGWGFGFAPADYQQGKATGSCTFTSRRRCGRWGCTWRWPSRPSSGVVWQIKMADLAIAALAPVGAVCTWWRWSAARHGASRCGDLVDLGCPSDLGAGAAVSVCRGSSPCGTPLTTAGWPGARRGSSCWSGWSICPSFITRSTGGTPCTRARPTCSKPSTQSMRLPLRICIFAFLTLSVTLTLMRLRNLILQLERRRPWVVALVNKGAAR